ncbi:MAG: acylphosphatase [Lachnospiraceae bacterium]|jgi:acylphosphatase|nr:acylphosphatase [Lachnospiraceae bacterium]
MSEKERTVRQHICFYGQVQGVGFRFRAAQMAEPLELTGWVRNVDDYVEMEVQGRESDIGRLLAKLQDSRWIVIDRYEASEMKPEKNERGFRVTW